MNQMCMRCPTFTGFYSTAQAGKPPINNKENKGKNINKNVQNMNKNKSPCLKKKPFRDLFSMITSPVFGPVRGKKGEKKQTNEMKKTATNRSHLTTTRHIELCRTIRHIQ